MPGAARAHDQFGSRIGLRDMDRDGDSDLFVADDADDRSLVLPGGGGGIGAKGWRTVKLRADFLQGVNREWIKKSVPARGPGDAMLAAWLINAGLSSSWASRRYRLVIGGPIRNCGSSRCTADYEVPLLPPRPTTLPVLFPLARAITKGEKDRTTWVHYDRLAAMHQYIDLDRAASAEGFTWRPPTKLGPMLLVENPDWEGTAPRDPSSPPWPPQARPTPTRRSPTRHQPTGVSSDGRWNTWNSPTRSCAWTSTTTTTTAPSPGPTPPSPPNSKNTWNTATDRSREQAARLASLRPCRAPLDQPNRPGSKSGVGSDDDVGDAQNASAVRETCVCWGCWMH